MSDSELIIGIGSFIIFISLCFLVFKKFVISNVKEYLYSNITEQQRDSQDYKIQADVKSYTHPIEAKCNQES
jgi:hypothetical protein